MIGLEISLSMTDKICRWFMSANSSERVELLCSLIQICLPQELWFIGCCIEDRSRKDVSQLLLEEEKKSNNVAEYDNMNFVESEFLDSVFLKRLITSVSLLKPSNSKCADRIFTFIVSIHKKLVGNGMKILNDALKDDLFLLFTLSAFHPAFIFKQRLLLSNILIDFKRAITELKYYRFHNEESSELNLSAIGIPDVTSNVIHANDGSAPLLITSPHCNHTEINKEVTSQSNKKCPVDKAPIVACDRRQTSSSSSSLQNDVHHKNKSITISSPLSTPSDVSPVVMVSSQMGKLHKSSGTPSKYSSVQVECDNLLEGMTKRTRKKFLMDIHGSRNLKEKSNLSECPPGMKSSSIKSSTHFMNLPSYPPSLDSSCSEDYLTPLGSPDIQTKKEDHTIGEGLQNVETSDLQSNQNYNESLQFYNQESPHSCDGKTRLNTKQNFVVTSDSTYFKNIGSLGSQHCTFHNNSSNNQPESKIPVETLPAAAQLNIHEAGNHQSGGNRSPQIVVSPISPPFSSVFHQNSGMTNSIDDFGDKTKDELFFHEASPSPPGVSMAMGYATSPVHYADRDSDSRDLSCHQCAHTCLPYVVPSWSLPMLCSFHQNPLTVMVAPISLNHLLCSSSAQFYQTHVGYAPLHQKPLMHVPDDKFTVNEVKQNETKQNGQMPVLPPSVVVMFDQNLKHFSGEHCHDNNNNSTCSNCGKFGHSTVACVEPSIDVELKSKSHQLGMKDSHKS